MTPERHRPTPREAGSLLANGGVLGRRPLIDKQDSAVPNQSCQPTLVSPPVLRVERIAVVEDHDDLRVGRGIVGLEEPPLVTARSADIVCRVGMLRVGVPRKVHGAPQILAGNGSS